MITLKTVLRSNAASCIIFGLMFVWAPLEIALFLGGETPAPEMVLLVLGSLLVVHGVHLLWASSIELPKKWLVLYFSAGDYLWGIASLALILTSTWITTSAGIFAAVFVAVIVATLGVLQMKKRKSMGCQ
jgi:hypothetical protein